MSSFKKALTKWASNINMQTMYDCHVDILACFAAIFETFQVKTSVKYNAVRKQQEKLF